jgi:hypothetical protein
MLNTTCVARENTPSLSIRYNGRIIGNSLSGQGCRAAKVRKAAFASSSCRLPCKSYPLRNMTRSFGRYFKSIKYLRACSVSTPSDNRSLIPSRPRVVRVNRTYKPCMSNLGFEQPGSIMLRMMRCSLLPWNF